MEVLGKGVQVVTYVPSYPSSAGSAGVGDEDGVDIIMTYVT